MMKREDGFNDESSSLAALSEDASTSALLAEIHGASDDKNSSADPRFRWYSSLAKDFEEMSDKERLAMDQDVRGTNEQAKSRASSLIIMHRTSTSSSRYTSTIISEPEHHQAVERMRQELRKRRRTEEPYGEGQSTFLARMVPSAVAGVDTVADSRRVAISPPNETTEPVWDTGVLSDNSSLILRFLLAARYDATEATDRLFKYLTLIHDLFGPAVAMRGSGEIRLKDLDKRSRQLLKSGWLQLLLCRDKHGRRIMTLHGVGEHCHGDMTKIEIKVSIDVDEVT
jgi:hypothetical protein